MTSELMAQRRAVYDKAVAAILRINPKAVPVARFEEPFAIMRVADQLRHTAPPVQPAPGPEAMLHSRVNNVRGTIAAMVAAAKRKGIPAELPSVDQAADLGIQLQQLNAAHDALEKKINYWNGTSQEQRSIDTLEIKLLRLEKQVNAIADAMAALNALLPHLMAEKAGAE